MNIEEMTYNDVMNDIACEEAEEIRSYLER